jgi:hypothetical protein
MTSVYRAEQPDESVDEQIVEVCESKGCDCKTVAMKHITPEQYYYLNKEARSALKRRNMGLVAAVLVCLLFWTAVGGALIAWLD